MIKNENQRSRKNRVRSVIPHPPSLAQCFRQNYTFRFRGPAAAGTVNVTQTELLDLLAVATAATTGVRLIQSARLKRVQVWVPPNPLATVPASVAVTGCVGTGPGGLNRVTDTAMGQTEAAYVDWRPLPSDASLWFSTSNANIVFQIAALGVYPIVDISMELIFIIGTGTGVATSALVGAVAGTVYYHYLDGAAATWLPEPLGLSTA